MRSVKDDTNRQIVVLLAGAIAGGLYGLLRTWPRDSTWIVKAVIDYGVCGFIAAYWAFIWLRPRRARGTLIGATIGAVIFAVVSSIQPEQILSTQRIFAIIDGVVVGIFIGALFGTAPHGAFIGAGLGAVAVALLVTVSFWLIGSHSFDLQVSVYAAFVGLFLGTWIGASRELNKRSKITMPHP
jgi:hypothetical protein